MKQASKPSQCPASIAADIRGLFSVVGTTRRRSKLFLYGFAFALVACTAYLAFFSAPGSSAFPWFNSLFSSASTAPYRSQISSFFSYIFPNSSSPEKAAPLPESSALGSGIVVENQTTAAVATPANGVNVKNSTGRGVGVTKDDDLAAKNLTGSDATKTDQAVKGGNGSAANDQQAKDGNNNSHKDAILAKANNETGNGVAAAKNQSAPITKSSSTVSKNESMKASAAIPKSDPPPAPTNAKKQGGASAETNASNSTTPPAKGDGTGVSGTRKKMEDWISGMKGCDIFQGNWVKDDSYPLYPEGSCPHIDEPFNCYLNGRPDRAYQKLRWQPYGCQIPRLNATDMLERLRGKRLVFVGDSLNRNMWESLVCVLRNSVKDKKKVFEASGRHEFRTEGSYSFVYRDYNCSVEFFRSPFLVQEWEMPSNGTTKETLRLDIMEKSSPKYKDADVLVFNTGHWWTHEKTSRGKDYYQEGNHVYSELNVVDAFHKALNTWAKWVDNNVNLTKTLVLFRGYSASHFSGGQWNSGGQCDKEIEPIKNEKYLSAYPPKMAVLESVIKNMKTPVSYLNITRMTDYRKDAHPSIYRKQNLTTEEEERRYQDCSHWCLPGVPDSWNEILYAQLLIKQHH